MSTANQGAADPGLGAPEHVPDQLHRALRLGHTRRDRQDDGPHDRHKGPPTPRLPRTSIPRHDAILLGISLCPLIVIMSVGSR